MSDSLEFFVTAGGAPLTGAAGTFTAIARTKPGAVRTAPGIVEVGGGVYRIVPNAGDDVIGTIVHVDCGAGRMPRRFTAAVFLSSGVNQFWAFSVENPDGTVWAGAAPTVGFYTFTPPALVAADGAYLFSATPTPGDIAAGAGIRIDGPAGSAQPWWSGYTVDAQPAGISLPISPSTLPAFSQQVDSTDYGTDVVAFPELSESLELMTGRRVLAEMALRRLSTARGLLAFHPDSGKDIRAYLNDTITDASIFAMRSEVEQELQRDERIKKATAAASYDSTAMTVTLNIALEPTVGSPFKLTVSVSSLTVELLALE